MFKITVQSVCSDERFTAVLSRQFRDMSRARIESLLASFTKVIPANTQHTSVETADVRYVYQPLEDLYILLITNKASNILQDIETLHLFARVGRFRAQARHRAQRSGQCCCYSVV